MRAPTEPLPLESTAGASGDASSRFVDPARRRGGTAACNGAVESLGAVCPFATAAALEPVVLEQGPGVREVLFVSPLVDFVGWRRGCAQVPPRRHDLLWARGSPRAPSRMRFARFQPAGSGRDPRIRSSALRFLASASGRVWRYFWVVVIWA